MDYDVDKLYFRPVSRCLGAVAAHEPLLSYEEDFLRNYAPATPALSWTIYLEGHEPSFRSMGALDAALAAHLLKLREAHGSHTALLLLSDHGIHYGSYHDGATAGLTEHSNPLLYLLLPRATLATRPVLERTLSANRRRLVSPFDLHATLLHLLTYPSPPDHPDWSDATMRRRPEWSRSADAAHDANVGPSCDGCVPIGSLAPDRGCSRPTQLARRDRNVEPATRARNVEPATYRSSPAPQPKRPAPRASAQAEAAESARERAGAARVRGSRHPPGGLPVRAAYARLMPARARPRGQNVAGCAAAAAPGGQIISFRRRCGLLRAALCSLSLSTCVALVVVLLGAFAEPLEFFSRGLAACSSVPRTPPLCVLVAASG